jgi:hypothetical protein
LDAVALGRVTQRKTVVVCAHRAGRHCDQISGGAVVTGKSGSHAVVNTVLSHVTLLQKKSSTVIRAAVSMLKRRMSLSSVKLRKMSLRPLETKANKITFR